jgi:protein TonB
VVSEVKEALIGQCGAVEAEPVPIPNPNPNRESSEEVFGVVEQMPSFPGGEKKLKEYFTENIHYPEELAESDVQGRVIVIFVVEKDGSISNVKVVKSLHPLLDKEAVRVVSLMPKWRPGKQNGVSYRVRYVIPVNFRLP